MYLLINPAFASKHIVENCEQERKAWVQDSLSPIPHCSLTNSLNIHCCVTFCLSRPPEPARMTKRGGDRQRERDRVKQADRRTTDRQTESQTGRQTHNRQTDRDRQRERQSQRGRQTHNLVPRLLLRCSIAHYATTRLATRLTMQTLTTYCTVLTGDVHTHPPLTALCPLVTYTHTHHVLHCAHQ